MLQGEKPLQRFDHVKSMDRTKIMRRVLALQFKGKRPVG
jgi:hypothetical protein